MKLDNIFKQIAMIALAAVVAVPATFGMKENQGAGGNDQPSDGFSNQSLKIEAGEKENKENGKLGELIELEHLDLLSEKDLEKNNTRCKSFKFCDIRFEFKGFKGWAFEDQLKLYSLDKKESVDAIVNGAWQQVSVSHGSPRWVAMMLLKSPLRKQIFEKFLHDKGLLLTTFGNVINSNLKFDVESQECAKEMGLMVLMSEQEMIEKFLREYVLWGKKGIQGINMDDNQKNQTIKTLVSLLGQFRKKIKLFSVKGSKDSQGLISTVDFGLMNHSNPDQFPLWFEDAHSVKIDKPTKQLKIVDKDDNLVSFMMPAGEFVKLFKHVEKICFPSSAPSLLGIILDNLGEFNNAKHFDLMNKSDLQLLLKKLIQMKKEFTEISLTRSCGSMNSDPSMSDLSVFDSIYYPSSDESFIETLKKFCMQFPKIERLNLAGWKMSDQDILDVVKLLKNLEVLVVSCGTQELQVALPGKCKLVIVRLRKDMVGREEFNADLFDRENMEIKKTEEE